MDAPASPPANRFAVTGTAGLAVLLVGGLGLAALLWLLTGPIAALDRAVAVAVNAWAAPQPLLIAAMEAVTSLGADLAAAVMLATLAVALLARGRTRLAIFVVVAGAGGAVIAPVLKALVGRLRPVLDAPITTAPGPSFPSGHALTVTLWVGSCCSCSCRRCRPARGGPSSARAWRSSCSSG
ncbi:MAG: hypothetical protein L0I24_09595 [Pseudonocardia sp.]|nr:hypothetical protein [Pseudonocardia sp.]